MDNIILNSTDILENIGDNHLCNKSQQKEYHVYCNQLGRKYVTILTGIEQINYDLKRLCSKLRNHFSCSCSIKNVKDKNGVSDTIFKLSGDHRKQLKEYLLTKSIIDNDDIFIIHG